MLVCIVNPLFKLLSVSNHTRWVVREAKVNYIGNLCRNVRSKVVFCCARHIDDVAPKTVFVLVTASARHNVCVNVYRVNRVTDSNLVVYRKDVADVAAITFCTVGKEDFVLCNVNASVGIVVLLDSVKNKIISVLRRISSKGSLTSHLINSLVHCINYCRSKRLCNVTDRKTDNVCLRMSSLIFSLLLCNSREKIA